MNLPFLIRWNSQIARLLYTNAGSAVLALCSNAVHKLWKWQVNERSNVSKVNMFRLTSLLVLFLVSLWLVFSRRVCEPCINQDAIK